MDGVADNCSLLVGEDHDLREKTVGLRTCDGMVATLARQVPLLDLVLGDLHDRSVAKKERRTSWPLDFGVDPVLEKSRVQLARPKGEIDFRRPPNLFDELTQRGAASSVRPGARPPAVPLVFEPLVGLSLVRKRMASSVPYPVDDVPGAHAPAREFLDCSEARSSSHVLTVPEVESRGLAL